MDIFINALLYNLINTLTVFITIVFGLAFLLMRLFRLYNRLPGRKPPILKFATLAPPLILSAIGLGHSAGHSPGFMIGYIVFILVATIFPWALFPFIESPFKKTLIKNALLVAAVLPFALDGANVLFGPLESRNYHFSINNHSGHEIILYEFQVDKKVLYDGHSNLLGHPEPSSTNPTPWRSHLRADLINPKKISLQIYDTVLGKPVRGELELTKDPNMEICGYSIVYGPNGFGHEPELCD